MLPAISHISAARFWYAYGSPNMPCVQPLQEEARRKEHGYPAQTLNTATVSMVRAAFYPTMQEPVHFLVEKQESRRILKGALCHSTGSAIPRECTASIESLPGISIVSPELSFIQMGTELSFVDLIRYGSTLCSLFAMGSRSPENESELFSREKPVASLESLTLASEHASNMRGVKNARRALRYLVENARSPLEIDTALHLCLPFQKGGFAIPKPRLNQKIWLDEPIETMDSRGRIRYLDSCECDLVWERGDTLVVVEYQGEAYHRDETNLHRDSVKINALNSQGVRVFTLTKRQLYDLGQFRRFSKSLSKALAAHGRSDIRDLEQRQRQLHARLMRPFKL